MGKTESTESIEFFKDGTVSVVDKGMSMGGSYRFVDDNRIRIELGGLGALVGPMVYRISISRGELTMTSPDGDFLRYQRVQ